MIYFNMSAMRNSRAAATRAAIDDARDNPAEWRPDKKATGVFYCSKCGETTTEDNRPYYCPVCSSFMFNSNEEDNDE